MSRRGGKLHTAIEFKGGTVTLMTLHVYSIDPATVQLALADRVGQAPQFFRDAPVVLDFGGVYSDTFSCAQAQDILEAVRSQHLQPIAARTSDNEAVQQALQEAGLPLLRALDKDRALTTGDDGEGEHQNNQEGAAAEPSEYSTTVDRVVRSGQQVYAPRGDLVIVGSSGAGSELIADGNIHVYGALRGRAICGINGNTKARIFCQSLEAELVSVAGTYKVLEDLADMQGRSAQIWLEQQLLRIGGL